MTRLHLLALAAGAALLSGTALAGDLPGSYPPPAEPAPAVPVEGASGWYLRGDIGVGIFHEDEDESFLALIGGTIPASELENFESRGGTFEDTVIIGGGIGYRVNDYFRFDATAEYRMAARFEETLYDIRCPAALFCGGNSSYDVESGYLTSVVGLVNAYADLGHFHGFSPFVGLGIGLARHEIEGFRDLGFGASNGGSGQADTESDWDLAWAVHAGVGYEVNQRLTLEASYRYLYMGDSPEVSVTCNGEFSGCYGAQLADLDSHDIRLGMRWNFGGEEPDYAPEPVVAKY